MLSTTDGGHRSSRHRRLLSVALAVFISGETRASADEQVPGTISRIEQKSQMIKRYKEMLQSEDRDMRLAAIEEGLGGPNRELRPLALDAAMKSGDNDLEAIAVRDILSRRTTLLVTILLPESADDSQKEFYGYANPIELTQLSTDKSGNIRGDSHFFQGHLLRNGLEGTLVPRQFKCGLNAKLTAPYKLTGTVACQGVTPLPVVIDLE